MQFMVRRLARAASDATAFSRASAARSAAAAGHLHRSGPPSAVLQNIPSSIDWLKSGILGPMRMQGGASVMRTLHSSASDSDSDTDDYPSCVDWTNSGILGHVRMQGANDCWAHAAVGTIEAINALVTGQYVGLSRKQVTDCSWKNSGMIGGYGRLVFEYVIKNGGLVPEVHYPYCSKWERHRKLNNVPLVTINDYGLVPHRSPAALCRALARQPVVVSLAIDSTFSLHKTLLLPAVHGAPSVNHDVIAVGYTDQKWKIMNSWNCQWGDGGFAEIPRSLDHLGGAYGILRSNAYYPIKTCENRYGNISHECLFSN